MNIENYQHKEPLEEASVNLYLPFPQEVPRTLPSQGRILSVYTGFNQHHSNNRYVETVRFTINDSSTKKNRGKEVNVPLGSKLQLLDKEKKAINGEMVFFAKGIESETMIRIKKEIGLNENKNKILSTLDDRVAFLVSISNPENILLPVDGLKFSYGGRYHLTKGNNKQEYFNRRNFRDVSNF